MLCFLFKHRDWVSCIFFKVLFSCVSLVHLIDVELIQLFIDLLVLEVVSLATDVLRNISNSLILIDGFEALVSLLELLSRIVLTSLSPIVVENVIEVLLELRLLLTE